MQNHKKPETLINTGFQLGNTWQHQKSPQNEAVNIAEAPKTAALAVLKASLGEDKYFLPYSSMEGVPLTNLIIDAFQEFIHKKKIKTIKIQKKFTFLKK